MGDIFLVIKIFVLTVLAMLFLQIKVGHQTLEQRSEAWIRSSSLVGHLQEVADGALIAFDKLMGRVDEAIKSDRGESSLADEQTPGQRHLSMKLERSKKFLKEKAAQAKNAVEEGLERVQEDYVEEEFADDHNHE